MELEPDPDAEADPEPDSSSELLRDKTVLLLRNHYQLKKDGLASFQLLKTKTR